MKVALIGYGRMGHEIEVIGLERGHTFPLIIDITNQEDLNSKRLNEADVAIDFSHPDAAPFNIAACFEAGIPIVAGTTGWHEQKEKIFELCRQKNGSLFYASNFSIGVNMLFAINRQLAELMNRFGDYTVSVREVHHTKKLDAPSGTAISLAEQIMDRYKGYEGWALTEMAKAQELPIEAVREGDVKGDHLVTYDSEIDSLYIGHHAKTRKGFAIGAVMAAEYLFGKIGIFTMDDLLELS